MSNIKGGKDSSKPCRIAVSSMGDSIESEVGSIGHCTHFIIFEGSPDNYRAIENEAHGLGSEAGIKAVEMLKPMDISAIITGNVGHRTFEVFSEAGVTVHAGCSGKVKDSIQRCLRGELPECKGTTFAGYIGF